MKTKIVILIIIILFLLFHFKSKDISTPIEIDNKPVIIQPKLADLEETVYPYQDYSEIYSTFEDWNKKAEDLVELNKYGKTDKNTDSYYIKISNEKNPSNNNVLMTACIHGNEPWSTSTLMSFMNKILTSYGKDERITKIINNRSLYFIPVISPDAYPDSRYVDRIDPNRNFPTSKEIEKKSIVIIENLKNFAKLIKPKAVLCGHTYGRVYLYPWGEKSEESEDNEIFKKIVDKMGALSQYRSIRASQLYGSPIYGSDVDWFYRNGAFPIVTEFGTHQRKPSKKDSEYELNRVYEALLHFIESAPEAPIKFKKIEDYGFFIKF